MCLRLKNQKIKSKTKENGSGTDSGNKNKLAIQSHIMDKTLTVKLSGNFQGKLYILELEICTMSQNLAYIDYFL